MFLGGENMKISVVKVTPVKNITPQAKGKEKLNTIN